MSGPKLVFSTIVILVIALGGFFGFYFYINKTTPVEQVPIVKTKPTFQGFDQTSLDPNTTITKPKNDYGPYDSTLEGSSTFSSSTQTIVSDGNQGTTTPVERPFQLRLISPLPVAGADFVIHTVDISTSSLQTATTTKKTKVVPKKLITSEFIRYVLKDNGNIFETSTSTATTTRITNKTLPKIQEAFFNTAGDGVIVRNIIGDDTIQTRYLSLKPDPTAPTSTILLVSSTDLPTNITEMTLSPDKAKIFYIRNDGPRGSIINFDGSAKISTFDSPFREWLVQWMTAGTILLNTKPSTLASGYLYTLDVKTSSVKKVLGDITGLTTLASKDGQNLAYTSTADNTLQLNYYNFKDGTSRNLFAQTLPEKCVWGNKFTLVIYCAVPQNVSNQNSYPDDWYLGLVHFNDVIWRINLRTGENKMIVDPQKQIGFGLDITNITISKNDDYLMFKDKNTISLWGIALKPAEVVVPTVKAPVKTTKK